MDVNNHDLEFDSGVSVMMSKPQTVKEKIHKLDFIKILKTFVHQYYYPKVKRQLREWETISVPHMSCKVTVSAADKNSNSQKKN